MKGVELINRAVTCTGKPRADGTLSVVTGFLVEELLKLTSIGNVALKQTLQDFLCALVSGIGPALKHFFSIFPAVPDKDTTQSG